VRCPRCGNENPETNRFCGMCGATMLQAPAGVGADSQSPVVASAARPASAQSTGDTARADRTPRAAAPAEESPMISGPSFLGLNEPAPRKSGSLSIDPRGASSRNVDYLLDDEDEPRRGGAGKYVLILVALALAVGMGYLRWRGQIQGWLGSDSKKPSATAQNADTSASSPPAPTSAPNTSTSCAPVTGMPGVCQIGSTSAGSSPSGSSLSSATQPNTTQPTAAAPSPSSASSSASSGAPAASTPTQTGGDSNAEAVPSAANAGAANSAPAASAAGSGSASTGNTPSNNATADSAGADAATTTPKSAPVEAQPSKPSAAEKPARAADPVSEAQKYLYGKGVPQNCDRGMHILKPAADQANAKAMIEMGALYSAGLCTPRDLPTAYRWFAMALRKDPDNQAVQTDLQKLWGEMTQPERQLAIRLSQ
jgi:hypothetical protein